MPHDHYLRNPPVPVEPEERGGPDEAVATDGSEGSEYLQCTSESEAESVESDDVLRSPRTQEERSIDDLDTKATETFNLKGDDSSMGSQESEDDGKDNLRDTVEAECTDDEEEKVKRKLIYRDLTQKEIDDKVASDNENSDDGSSANSDESDVLGFEDNPDLDKEDINPEQDIDKTDPSDLPDQASRDNAFVRLTDAAMAHWKMAKKYDIHFQILSRAYERHSVVTDNIFYKYILLHWRDDEEWSYDPTQEEMALHEEQNQLLYEMSKIGHHLQSLYRRIHLILKQCDKFEGSTVPSQWRTKFNAIATKFQKENDEVTRPVDDLNDYQTINETYRERKKKLETDDTTRQKMEKMARENAQRNFASVRRSHKRDREDDSDDSNDSDTLVVSGGDNPWHEHERHIKFMIRQSKRDRSRKRSDDPDPSWDLEHEQDMKLNGGPSAHDRLEQWRDEDAKYEKGAISSDEDDEENKSKDNKKQSLVDWYKKNKNGIKAKWMKTEEYANQNLTNRKANTEAFIKFVKQMYRRLLPPPKPEEENEDDGGDGSEPEYEDTEIVKKEAWIHNNWKDLNKKFEFDTSKRSFELFTNERYNSYLNEQSKKMKKKSPKDKAVGGKKTKKGLKGGEAGATGEADGKTPKKGSKKGSKDGATSVTGGEKNENDPKHGAVGAAGAAGASGVDGVRKTEKEPNNGKQVFSHEPPLPRVHTELPPVGHYRSDAWFIQQKVKLYEKLVYRVNRLTEVETSVAKLERGSERTKLEEQVKNRIVKVDKTKQEIVQLEAWYSKINKKPIPSSPPPE
jgi:hypothetical protein